MQHTTTTTTESESERSSETAVKPIMEQINKILSPPSDLLQWKDMPQHLQFNPYVLTGYRPLQTFKGCVNSLFYMHNETINILTHGEFENFLIIFTLLLFLFIV